MTKILNLESNDQTQETGEPATPSVEDQVKSALDQLVGDGKKFKTEEDLAKGKLESDRFIERVLEEQKGMRETIAELQEKLVRAETKGEVDDLRRQLSERNAEQESKEETPSSLTQDDLDSLIEARITERETRASAKANVDQTNDALVTHYGDPEKASTAVQSRLKELGLSLEDLTSMAAKSPSAALSLVYGADGQKRPEELSLQSTANVPPRETPKDSKAAFDELRRKDPKRYWSPEVQNRIFQLAQAGTYN